MDATALSSHSLRSGFCSEAALSGLSEREIMTQTLHKDVATVSGYIRIADLFQQNAAKKIGL
jgi:integrase